MTKQRPSETERFWRFVNRSGDNDCWLWTGCRNAQGYGHFQRNTGVNQSRPFRAHRVAWELTNGPIQRGLQVCHRCDNPPCCNPAHLFLGTAKDNIGDMHSKGRHNKTNTAFTCDRVLGERNNSARLTAEQAVEIRLRYALERVTCEKLADQYGVAFATIQALLSGRIWKHVA